MLERLNHWFFSKHLDDDEEVRLLVHKHWRLGIHSLFWPTLSFLASWAFLVIAPFLTIFYIVAFWSMVSLVWWMRNFLDYFLDAWIVTNQAIIDVKWHGWFHRTATKILFSDIQGVSYEVKGIGGTLLRYGTVSIEKVSTGGTVTLENVSRPRGVQMAILRNMEDYMHSKNLKDAKRVQELMADVIARELHLDELGKKKPAPRVP
ncbi:MAG: PH domain-containing protein [Candidatus Peribacteraceae bacterium]|nr:PH domain-containing protein [Candidatus Peribacteraceae bacterium]